MLLFVSTNFYGWFGLILLVGGFFISVIYNFITDFYDPKGNNRTFNFFRYVLYSIPTIGLMSLMTFLGKASNDAKLEEINSRKYIDVVEVYDGNSKIKEYKGEILLFRTLKDCYFVRMEEKPGCVIDIREPKSYTLIKKDY